jgi:hypothetical protein
LPLGNAGAKDIDMSEKRGNGNGGGDVQSAMLDGLKAIHESVETSRIELRGELQGVRGELRQVKDEPRAGFAEVRGELHEVGERLEHIHDLACDRYRALEERVARLEARNPASR